MKKVLLLNAIALLSLFSAYAGTIIPADWGSDLTGYWTFDNSANLLEATVGNELVFINSGGDLVEITGAYANDGAVTVPLGSYFDCDHLITGGAGGGGNGGGTYINQYTLVFDFKVTTIGSWHTFFQTNSANSNDGEAFINPSGGIGVGDTGYSPNGTVTEEEWYRLAISVDLGNTYKYYLNGELIQDGGVQTFDGRFAVEDFEIKLFADNNGDDATIDVTSVAVFNRPLTDDEAKVLGGVPDGDLDCSENPSALAATGLDASTAFVSWTEGGNPNNYEIQYGEAGFTLGTGVIEISNDTFINLSGLLPNTNYDVYVRGVCGSIDSTDWVGPASFATLGCTPPTNLTLDIANAVAAKVSWTGSGFTNWNLEYGPAGFTQGTGTTASDIANEFYILNNLEENTSYDVYVQEVCGGVNSDWEGPLNFTTSTNPVEGGDDNAIELDGILDTAFLSGYTSAASLGLPQEEITVAAWINVNSFNDYAGVIGFMQDNGSFERGWLLHTRSNGTISFIAATDDSQVLDYGNQVPINGNEWVHVAGTYDGTDVKVYVNGIEELSFPKGGNISYSDSWLVIGRYKDDNEDYIFDGKIDDVAVFNKALNQSELLDWICGKIQPGNSLYNNNLVTYHPMADGSGNTITDVKGINNGILGGPAWTTSEEMFDCDDPVGEADFNAVVFNETPDYIDTDWDPAFGTDQDFSIEFRIKSNGWDSDPAILSDKDWGSGSNAGFNIALCGNGNGIDVNIGDGSNRADLCSGNISDGTWHHVLIAVDRDAMVSMYIDGVFVEEGDMTALGDITSPFTFKMGQDGTGSYSANATCELSDVRIWNKVLNVNESAAYRCVRVDNTHPSYADLIHYWKLDEGTGTEVADEIGGNTGTFVAGTAWTLLNNFPSAIAAFDVIANLSNVSFLNNSTFGNYFWNFGDNTTSTAINPSHLYTQVGTYEVTLVAQNACDSDTLTQTVEITALDNNLLTSLDLDGTDDIVVLTNDLNFGSTGDFSVELFVKSTGWTSDPSIIANKDWGSGSNPGFILAGKSDSETWKFNIGDGSDRIDLDGGAINDDTWHHIVVTYDQDGVKRVYTDGVINEESTDVIGNVDSPLDLAIGEDGTLNYGPKFKGQVAEVRIWGVALDSATVVDFLCGADSDHPNFDDLIHYWVADEGTGTEVNDSKGTNTGAYNGEWTLSANTFPNCKADAPENKIGSGNAIDFTGVDGNTNGHWIDFSGNDGEKVAAADLGLPTSAITLECWVKVHTYDIWHSMVAFIQDNGSFERGWDLETRDNNKFAFTIKTLGSSSLTYMETTSQFEEEVWYHVAGTYDGNTMKIYVNGVLEREDGISQSGDIDYVDSWLNVGMYRDDNEFFNLDGTIDEVRIWDYARTEDEIRMDMCQKLEGTETGLYAYWRFDRISGEEVRDYGPNDLTGVIQNLPPALGRVTSGAAIGDESIELYTDNWGGQVLTMMSASNGIFEASDIDGNPSGVHVYRVDEAPNTNNGIFDPGNNNVYFGTFIAEGLGASHKVIYDYSNYQEALDNEADLNVYNRPSNASTTWFNAGGSLDTGMDEYVIEGVGSRREFILADFSPVTCEAVTDLAADDITFKSALLTWASSATEFNLEYGPIGFEFGTGTMVAGITETSYLLEGLDPRTSYEFYVQAICPMDQSAWAGPFSFATLDPCPESGDFAIENITTNSADFAWTAAPTIFKWDIQWGFEGFSLGAGIITTAETNPFTLTGLQPGTAFDAYLQSNCDSLSSQYIGPISFITECPVPENLSVTAANNIAVVQWDSPAGINDWTLEWGAEGFTPGTGTVVEVEENPYILGDLPIGESIDIYIFTECNDTISVTSGSVNVTVVNTQEVTAETFNFELMPNPAQSATTVVFGKALNAETTLTLTNVLGEVVFSAELAAGTKQTAINVNELTAGAYFVSLKSTDNSITKRLIVE